jgi:hypothetical protein
MPNTLIATRAGWISEPQAVIAAIHSALREALKIPEADRTLRLIEHSASHFAVPPVAARNSHWLKSRCFPDDR